MGLFSSKPGLTPDSIRDALTKVIDPVSKRDVASSGLVQGLEIENGVVHLLVATASAAGAVMKEPLARDIEAQLKKIGGFQSLSIEWAPAQPSSPGATAASDMPGGPGAANPAKPQAAGPPSRPANNLTPTVRHIIGVASGKGGVGKSTVAVNLAVALAQSGAAVGLLDADIHGPNIPTMMGVRRSPIERAGRIIPLENHGVKFISMGILIPEDQAVVWRGPMLNNALRQFFGDVEWGSLDYLIVDLPPGTGDVQLSLVQLVRVTGCIVVTTPQAVSVQDARKGLAMFGHTNTPILGIVENMAYFVCDQCDKRHDLFGTGGGAKLAESLGLPLLATLPLAQAVREGGDAGAPITVSQPQSEAAAQFRALAADIAARVETMSGAQVAAPEIRLAPRPGR